MPEPRIFEYESDKIVVRYDLKRCIHAKECVHGLPQVFDPKKRPWIEPDQAAADDLAEVVLRCPTGALHYSRKDDGPAEPTPTENRARIAGDGPIYLEGKLELHNAEGELQMQESRIALCRCGKSANKPFCDNAHIEAEFSDAGVLDAADDSTAENTGVLKLKILKDGPILVNGGLELKGSNNSATQRLEKAAFCRCGASANKPFCDGSHVKAGFTAE